MIDRFKDFIKQEHLIAEGQRVLLAVSGGRDSVTLCHLMRCAGIPFGIAHCNFGLRPGDCDRDEEFVSQLAESYGVPFHPKRFDTRLYASENRLSIEEAARNLRYTFFEQVRQSAGYDLIATAHHADDEIETFFINLIRGTGISGLHGIKSRNGFVIRPMLAFSRADIDAYSKKNCLEYVDDSTNFEPIYLRNKIRLQLLPLLREIRPEFDEVMRANISRFAEAETVYREQVEMVRNHCLRMEEDHYEIDLEALGRELPRKTYLFELLRPFGFNPSVCEQIAESVDAQCGKRFFSSTHRVVKDRGRLIVTPIEVTDRDEDFRYIRQWDFPYVGDIVCAEIEEVLDVFPFKLGPMEAWFDYDRVSFPLLLRHWRSGDRFVPFGMRGSRLVSDLFSDRKMSLLEKESAWLLCDSDGLILWVVGIRASSVASVTLETRRILKVRQLS